MDYTQASNRRDKEDKKIIQEYKKVLVALPGLIRHTDLPNAKTRILVALEQAAQGETKGIEDLLKELQKRQSEKGTPAEVAEIEHYREALQRLAAVRPNLNLSRGWHSEVTFAPTNPEAFFQQLFSGDPDECRKALDQVEEAIEGKILDNTTFGQFLQTAMHQEDTRVLNALPIIYPYLTPDQVRSLAHKRFDEPWLIKAMQKPECSNHQRRAAGLLLGIIGWQPADLDQFLPITEQHKTLYYIARYPVTNVQYQRFIEAGGYKMGESIWEPAGLSWLKKSNLTAPQSWYSQNWLNWKNPIFPIVGIGWYEACAYANWLEQRINDSPEQFGLKSTNRYVVRLPTEQEWERGARGTDGREFPWGNEFQISNANTADGAAGATTAVTTFPDGRSPVGAWDLSGNVWEWTASHYPGEKPYPVLRGGSFVDYHDYTRSTSRGGEDRPFADINIGFRLVVSVRS